MLSKVIFMNFLHIYPAIDPNQIAGNVFLIIKTED
jgi:hypothetical protein